MNKILVFLKGAEQFLARSIVVVFILTMMVVLVSIAAALIQSLIITF